MYVSHRRQSAHTEQANHAPLMKLSPLSTSRLGKLKLGNSKKHTSGTIGTRFDSAKYKIPAA
jgi:hypothetical protein